MEELNNQKLKKYNIQIKLICILSIVFLIMLFISLITYNSSDQQNINVSYIDIIMNLLGDNSLDAKSSITKNWLGLIGAKVSDLIYNSFFGYYFFSLPLVLIYLIILVLFNKKINEFILKYILIYFVFGILFSGFVGSLQQIDYLKSIPKEWSGQIGQFLGYYISKFLTPLGSILIFSMGIVLLIYFSKELRLYVNLNFKKIKELFNNLKFNSDNIENKENIETINQNNNIINELEEKEKIINNELQKNNYESNSLIFNEIKENKEITEIIKPPKLNIKIIDENKIYSNLNKENDKSEIKNTNFNEKSNEKNNLDDNIVQESTTKSDFIKINIDEEVNHKINKKNVNEESLSSDIELNENQQEAPKKELRIEIKKSVTNKEIKEIPSISTYIHDEEINYTPPKSELLINELSASFINDLELETNARILQEKLETFNIYIEDLSVTPGPVVTQYEFVPAPGIKISKIESLSDDLAMALKAKGIRIIAPIPGKGTIGVEIPNNNPSIVRFGEIVNSPKFINTSAKLPIALGKTISGEVYIADLVKMPHLLIAGSTGSGKSVGINTIIASLLYKKHPSELKFVIIDPKKVELQQFAALENHFIATSPDINDLIVTKPEDAVTILKAAVKEMELRYDILASVGQRNIIDFNDKITKGTLKDNDKYNYKPMPYIVIIIDELADLMLTASKEVEEPITRLAQMARATGIHLIIATQRPSVDIITGVIKANFAARIAYFVKSKIDSRTILDMQGAEQLLGQGDMLFLPPGQPKPTRIQNALITTDEVEKICEYIENQKGYSEPYYLPSLIEKNNKESINPEDRDPLFEEAARLIIRTQQGSVSLIQRRLKVGYARAGRIIDELEAAGVVGPFDGSKARQVLMESESELEAIL